MSSQSLQEAWWGAWGAVQLACGGAQGWVWLNGYWTDRICSQECGPGHGSPSLLSSSPVCMCKLRCHCSIKARKALCTLQCTVKMGGLGY